MKKVSNLMYIMAFTAALGAVLSAGLLYAV